MRQVLDDAPSLWQARPGDNADKVSEPSSGRLVEENRFRFLTLFDCLGRTGGIMGRPKPGASGRLDASSTSRDDHRTRTVSHCPDQSLSLGRQRARGSHRRGNTAFHLLRQLLPVGAGLLPLSPSARRRPRPVCRSVCGRMYQRPCARDAETLGHRCQRALPPPGGP